MPSLGQHLNGQSFHHVLVYGPPKAGKTAMVLSLAKHYNLIWIDAEDGLRTALNPELGLTPENLEHVQVISLPDNAQYPIAAETVYTLFHPKTWNTPTAVCAKHGKVRCPVCTKKGGEVDSIALGTAGRDTIIVLDSFTQFASSVLAALTGGKPTVLDEDLKQVQAVTPPAMDINSAFVKADFDTWAKQGAVLASVLSAIQTLRAHVIVITHEMALPQEDGTEKLMPAGGTTNFSRNVARYFGEVIRCSVSAARKHVAGSKTTHMPGVMTGSRTGTDTSKLDMQQALLSIFTEYREYRPVNEASK